MCVCACGCLHLLHTTARDGGDFEVRDLNHQFFFLAGWLKVRQGIVVLIVTLHTLTTCALCVCVCVCVCVWVWVFVCVCVCVCVTLELEGGNMI